MRLLNDFQPITAVEQTRYDLAHELLDDVERLEVQLKESHRRIRTAVTASGTSLIELYGVGPILACELIGYTGDVRRFTTRDQFGSYAGVAPIELSRGASSTVSVAGATASSTTPSTWWPSARSARDSEGRIYFEEGGRGKTKPEAIRSLKRQVSNAVYRQLLIDAQK